MPIRPKPANLPWIVKTDYNIPGQGRKVRSGFYQSTAWRKFVKMFKNSISYHLGTLQPHPNVLCIDCTKRGRITEGEIQIDHIKPVNPANPYDTMNGKYGEPLLFENCQPLCESCHGRKSNKDKNR